MNEYKSIDNLVSEIMGTTTLIGKLLFNWNSFLIAAGISLLFVVLIWVV
jgi:hypothetical protein